MDAHELHKLSADLTKAGLGAAVKARAIALKGGLNIQRTARDLVDGRPTLPAYPSSITTDVGQEGTTIYAEVGPDKDKAQGPLGNLIEYGTTEKSPPIPHLGPALDQEEPNFEHHMTEAGGKIL